MKISYDTKDRLIEAAAGKMAEDDGDPYDRRYGASYRLWTGRAQIAVDAVLSELDIQVGYDDE